MRYLSLLTLIFVTSSAWSSVGPDVNTPLDLYQSGIRAFQESNYEDSLKAFTNFVSKEPNNVPGLFNLGLSAYKSSQRGLALGAWRRALSLNPKYTPAKEALLFASTEMPQEVFRLTPGFWGDLEQYFLVPTTLDQYLFLTAFLLLSGGILVVNYLGRRRRALKEESAMPPFPSIGLLFVILFFASVILTGAKAYWDHVPRATVISQTLKLYSGPSASNNVLFDLSEGFQVVVRQSTQDWALVSYPGGLTGWAPQEDLFQTTGAPKW